MPTFLLSADHSIKLDELAESVPDCYETAIEDKVIRMLVVHHQDGGLIVQVNEEDEEENGEVMGDCVGRDDLPDAFAELLEKRALHFVLCACNANYNKDVAKVTHSWVTAGLIRFIDKGNDVVDGSNDDRAS